MANKPNTLEVRKPVVSVEGEKTDSLELVWNLPLNSFSSGAPAAKYSAHPPGSNKVFSPNAAELIKKIADAQNSMFAPAQVKTITVQDGSQQTLSFIGYDAAPSHSVMFGRVSNGKTLVHRCSKLFFINTSIYHLPPDKFALFPEEIESFKSPTEMMKLVLQRCLDTFEESLESDTSLSDKGTALLKRIHNKNLEVINELWFPILDASTESDLDSFSEVMEKIYIVRDKTFNSIYQSYVNNNTDFSTVISQFCSMFQMVFIPSTDGRAPGKFISYKKMMSDPEEKDVVISSIAMSPGASRFLTVSGVFIQGAPGDNYWGLLSDGSGVVSWPEEIPEQGELIPMSAPSWIPRELFPEETPPDGKNLDLNENANIAEAKAAERKEDANVVEKVLKEMARLAYNNAALGPATATIVTVLDVSWEIGKRYAVKQAGGDLLFSGFLKGLTHRVSSSPDSPEAVTQLTFSHIETNGFTLPNK